MRIDGKNLASASAAALALAMLMPASAWAQAAKVPATDTPGSPAQVDPAPVQSAVVPNNDTTAPDPAAATVAQDPAESTNGGDGAEIVVTGFRKSLDAALNVKRDSVSAVDAIVAEDIAKFPDQNLAESLQRIPGISIQRDAGEGRAITVRGLGAQFTPRPRQWAGDGRHLDRWRLGQPRPRLRL